MQRPLFYTTNKKRGPHGAPFQVLLEGQGRGLGCRQRRPILKCNYELFHNFFFKDIFQLVIALTANTVNSFSVHCILQSGEGHGV